MCHAFVDTVPHRFFQVQCKFKLSLAFLRLHTRCVAALSQENTDLALLFCFLQVVDGSKIVQICC
jgi:hypothetical protein